MTSEIKKKLLEITKIITQMKNLVNTVSCVYLDNKPHSDLEDPCKQEEVSTAWWSVEREPQHKQRALWQRMSDL